MSEQETEEEPSIEEILTSIRQIISDDDEEAAAEEVVADEPAPEPEPEEEVIELTDRIDDDSEAVAEPEPEPEEESEEFEPEPEPIEVEMQDSVAPPEPVSREDDEDTLLTSAAEDAAFDAFSELAKKTAIEHGGITVEEIVRSELRPLLKDWLDKNLPPIIERLVQEELERVAKRALEE
ncbi:MAG: DUF2497 domain-containing protein [Rhodospirillales bacterium]|nr:DUF2497 domain-containing protein [Rhodospirillales bacterium]